MESLVMRHLMSVLATIISIYIVLAAMRLLLVVEKEKFYPDVVFVETVDCTSVPVNEGLKQVIGFVYYKTQFSVANHSMSCHSHNTETSEWQKEIHSPDVNSQRVPTWNGHGAWQFSQMLLQPLHRFCYFWRAVHADTT